MSHANHRRGEIVAVCYDGKWGRRVTGQVIDMKRDKILVRFALWTEEPAMIVERWFRKRRSQWDRRKRYYGAFIDIEQSIMRVFFGLPGDWYSVYECKPSAFNTSGVE